MTSKLNETMVAKRITQGVYTHKKREEKGRIGKFYRIMDDIFDENDDAVAGFYYCRECHEVVECKVSGGTAKLNRHADDCDPPYSKKSDSESKNVPLSEPESDSEPQSKGISNLFL